MPTTSMTASQLFISEVPVGFLDDSLRCLARAYDGSFQRCIDLDLPLEVAHDFIAQERRMRIESQWPLVAKNYPGSIVRYNKNRGGNCNHALIQFGQVILTCSFIDRKVRTVRRAMYRDGYARSGQTYLFDMGLAEPPPDAPLYGILMHDGIDLKQSKLGKAKIIFPDPDGKIVEEINLGGRIATIFAAEFDTAPINVVDEELPIELIAQPAQSKARKSS